MKLVEASLSMAKERHQKNVSPSSFRFWYYLKLTVIDHLAWIDGLLGCPELLELQRLSVVKSQGSRENAKVGDSTRHRDSHPVASVEVPRFIPIFAGLGTTRNQIEGTTNILGEAHAGIPTTEVYRSLTCDHAIISNQTLHQ